MSIEPTIPDVPPKMSSPIGGQSFDLRPPVLIALLRALRPRQGTKNAMVFVATVAAGTFDTSSAVWRCRHRRVRGGEDGGRGVGESAGLGENERTTVARRNRGRWWRQGFECRDAPELRESRSSSLV